MADVTIFDTPPEPIATDLDDLRVALDHHVPRKELDRNLLIATWNIRAFGSVTRKWTASGGDSPKRDMRGLRAILEIVSRFDVVAIQEVTGDLRALRDLVKGLGRHWSFLMSDVTLGKDGHSERMAYVFDTRRVELSGLAGELVVPPEWTEEIEPAALRRQFARTPYAVSFRSGLHTFILVALHVTYGDPSAERVPELRGIADWLSDWARRLNRRPLRHDLITLGDFNIDRKDDALWQAFTSRGLHVPDELNRVRRTIFASLDEPTLDRFYDQIAWFDSGTRKLSMGLRSAGGFEFLPFVYRDTSLTKSQVSYRISDHIPLWAEFSLGS
jgi:endonuclease/exonuclease/phosphatase family metal-dependent hydrolase